MVDFSGAKGATVAEETQIKQASSARLDAVKLDDGKRVFVRVLTPQDELITVNIHRYVPVTTKPTAAMNAKAEKAGKDKANWPESMWAVCPKDKVFQGDDGYDGSCLIETKFAGQKGGQYNKPLDKIDRWTYAVVVLQEATYEGSKVTSLTDKMESWTDKEGTEHKVPAVRYLAQSWRNIWSAAISAVNMAEQDDVYDQVLMLKRDGTDYTVLLVQGNKAKSTETQREVYAKALEMMGFTLEDFILAHASASHYDRFWGAGPQDKADDGDSAEVDGAAGTVTEPDAGAGAVPDPEAESRISSFADQLGAQAKEAGAKEAPAADESADDGAMVMG